MPDNPSKDGLVERLDREEIGRLMHEAWAATKRKQGFHGPMDMENCEDKNYLNETDFICQCAYLHDDLIPWEELPETQKEINRHAFDCALLYFDKLITAHTEEAVAVERERLCQLVCSFCETTTDNLHDAGEEGWFHEIEVVHHREDLVEDDGVERYIEPVPCVASAIRSSTPNHDAVIKSIEERGAIEEHHRTCDGGASCSRCSELGTVYRGDSG